MDYSKPEGTKKMKNLISNMMISIKLKLIIIFSGLILILNISDSKCNPADPNDSLNISDQLYFIEAIPDSINNVTLIRFVIPEESIIKMYITDISSNEIYMLADGEMKEGEHFVYYKNCSADSSGKCKCRMEVYSPETKALSGNFEISIK